MLTAEAQQRLSVILVGVRNPQNIGAAARAMRDLGFADLRVVNEFTPPFEAAQLEATSAIAAGDILQNARRFDRLEDAIADCSLIVGTTAIGARGLQQPVLRLQDAAPSILAKLRHIPLTEQQEKPAPSDSDSLSLPSTKAPSGESRVALLFGSEKTGLTNEQLSHCSLLLTIPMFAPSGRHLSMNLGQAVAVCLYELVREGFTGVRELPPRSEQPSTSADRERLHALLLAAMDQSGYSRRFPANARPTVVRGLVQSLGNGKEQTETWMGVFRMVLSALSGQTSTRSPVEE